nr:MAG TPA: hypothetical protein [Caudoviricetes sp.]
MYLKQSKFLKMKFKLYLWIVRCRDGFNVQ